MEEPHPKLSICLPILNGIEFLEERMASIVSQSFKDWELIVCDSYSTDGTWEFLQKFKNDKRVRLYQVPKEGLYAGWNECLRRVRGEFIYIATADDTAQPDFLRVMIDLLEANTPSSAAISRTVAIDESSLEIDSFSTDFWNHMNQWRQTEHKIAGLSMFLVLVAFDGNWGSITGVVFRSVILDKIGLFRTDMSYLADCEWVLRLCLASDWLIISSNRGATWRIHKNQASHHWGLLESKIYHDSLSCLIASQETAFPQHWRSVPQWKAKLLRRRSVDYEVQSGLFLFNLKSAPLDFLKLFIFCLIHSPSILLRRLYAGFHWSQNLQFDSAEWSQMLCRDFQAPWPPEVLNTRSSQASENTSYPLLKDT